MRALVSVLVALLLTACSDRSKSSTTYPVRGTEVKRHVVVVVIDTLPAKHVGFGIGPAGVSPMLDRFAADGTTFRRTYSTAPWTRPAVGSILTGVMPSRHEVVGVRGKFSSEVRTLAERLSARGFATGGVVSHTFVAPTTDFKRGFSHYELVPFRGDVHATITSDQVTDHALRWIDGARTTDQPLFLFAHYFDPHFNYQHHPQFDRSSWYRGSLTPNHNFRQIRRLLPTFTPDDVRYLVDLFREEILFTDTHVHRLLEGLRERGILNDAVVVITADHGEEFLEHGNVGHGRSMFDEVIRVPMVWWAPGLVPTGLRTEALATTMSITPTIQDLLGFGPPKGGEFDARPLFSRSGSGGAVAAPAFVLSEVQYNAQLVAATGAEAKLIIDKKSDTMTGFHLAKDPEELTPIVDIGSSSALAALREPLVSFIREVQGDASVVAESPAELEAQLPPEEVEKLKSLGYL